VDSEGVDEEKKAGSSSYIPGKVGWWWVMGQLEGR